MVAPAYNWSGFYLNAGGGYGMWNADTQVFFPGGACLTCVVDTFGGRGYFGTAGGGYDFQLGGLGMGAWNPTIVVGLLGGLQLRKLQRHDGCRRRRRRADQRNRRLGRRRAHWSGLRTEFLHLHEWWRDWHPFWRHELRLIDHRRAGRPYVVGFLEDRLVPRRRHRDFAGSDFAGRLVPAQRISLRLLQHDECSASLRRVSRPRR